ncbi:MAG TPA: hypothetical protein VLH58_10930 [Candidatus Methylomirabilis sp.]|nr:hypothetical protein [Candidatus Methylomirabilis sp.]
MKHRALTCCWWGQAAVILAAVLVLPIGVCNVTGHHSEHGNHGMSPELCAGLSVIPASAVNLTGPIINGWHVPSPSISFAPNLPDLLYRPPEPSPLS